MDINKCYLILRKENNLQSIGFGLRLKKLRPVGYGRLGKEMGTDIFYSPYTGKECNISAHTFAYRIVVGHVPNGLELDHLCRVRHCVNPNHLEPVTRKENVLRGAGISAQNSRKVYCKRGHKFTEETTKLKQQKYGVVRACIICRRLTEELQRRAEGIKPRNFKKLC